MGMVTMELLQYNRAVKQCFQEMCVETLMKNYIGKFWCVQDFSILEGRASDDELAQWIMQQLLF